MGQITGLLTGTLVLAFCLSAQEWAKAELEKSPRHQEWVKISAPGRVIEAFLVFPEVQQKAPAVIVIHENAGLTDWVRTVADQLAQHGYLAIAPDLLSGKAPGKGKTADFPSVDDARKAIYELKPDEVIEALNAVADFVKGVPASNGKLAVAGFCWGGSQTFLFATKRHDLSAAFVFYGTGPDQVSTIRAPVYGFYGSNDERVNATIPKSRDLMAQAGKVYEPVIYEGAGHGFMRSGQDPSGSEANRMARQEAWRRWLELLAKNVATRTPPQGIKPQSTP